MRLILAIATALMFAASPPSALANPPVHEHLQVTVPFTVGDVCSFPVDVTGTFDLNTAAFFDNAGTLVRAHAAVVETDVFSANGKSLTSVPYHYSVEEFYDAAGNVTASWDTGVVARVRLPDGSWFVAAGRQDVSSGQTLLIPDAGTSGNIAGFCAALSA